MIQRVSRPMLTIAFALTLLASVMLPTATYAAEMEEEPHHLIAHAATVVGHADSFIESADGMVESIDALVETVDLIVEEVDAAVEAGDFAHADDATDLGGEEMDG